LLIKFINGGIIVAMDRGDQRVVFPLVQPMKKIAQKFIITNGFPKSRELRSKTLHLGEVLISSHGEFLGVIELLTQMLSLGTRRCFEHARDTGPGCSCSVHVQNMRQNFG
jgi:hypothetical protein